MTCSVSCRTLTLHCCMLWQSQYSSQERLHLGSVLTPDYSPATPSSLTRSSRQHYDSSNDSSTPLVEAERGDLPSNSSSNSSGVRSPLIRPRSHSLRSVVLQVANAVGICIRYLWQFVLQILICRSDLQYEIFRILVLIVIMYSVCATPCAAVKFAVLNNSFNIVVH